MKRTPLMMGLEDQQIDVSDDLSEFDDADLESDPNDTFDGFDLVSNIAGLQSDLRDSHDLVAAATSLDQLEDYRENLMEKDEVSDDDMNNYQSMAEMAVGGNDPVEVGFMPVTENYGSNKMALEAIGARNAVALESIYEHIKNVNASIQKRLRRISYYFKFQRNKLLSLKKDLDKADFPSEGISIDLKVTNELKYGDHNECKSIEEYSKQFSLFVDFTNRITKDFIAYNEELNDKFKESMKIFFKSSSKKEDERLIADMVVDFNKSVLKFPTMHKVPSPGSDRYWEVFTSQTFIGGIYIEYRTGLNNISLSDEDNLSKIRSAVSRTTLTTKVKVNEGESNKKHVVHLDHISKAEVHRLLDTFIEFWSNQSKHGDNLAVMTEQWTMSMPKSENGKADIIDIIRELRNVYNASLAINNHMRSEIINCAVGFWQKANLQISNGNRMVKKIIWSA